MASPMAAGVLASLLSRDESYTGVPRDAQRAVAAKLRLAQHCRSVALNPYYQGCGLARTGSQVLAGESRKQ
jgi:hypothetical protein